MKINKLSTNQYKWVVVAMLWTVCFFNYADRQGIFSIFPVLKETMNLSEVQLGLIGSAFMWVYASSGWLAGMVGDRFRRKTVILSGFFFWSVITLLFGFATEYWHLVALRAIEGLGEAFYFPAAMAMLSAYHGRDTRSRAMGIHQSSVYLGTVAGGSLTGWIADYWGWRYSFFLFGGCGIVLVFILLIFLREPEGLAESDESEASSPPASAWELLKGIYIVLRIPMVLILIVVFIGANSVASIFLTWTPKFLYDKFNMSLTMAGFSATVYLQVGSVIGVLCGGMLADRLRARYRGGRMITQSLGLYGGVPFIFVVGWTLQVPILVVAMACFGFFKGIYDANIWASLHDVVPAQRRATAVGVMNSLGWLSGGISAVSIAWASQRFGMSVCISANSMVYLFFGLLLSGGVYLFMRGKAVQS